LEQTNYPGIHRREYINIMIYIGYHASIAKGFYRAAAEAHSIGANTFQFFSRNPRGGKAKALDLVDISKCAEVLKENNFGPLLAHAPYTLNLCSDRDDIRAFAFDLLRDDIERIKQLPDTRYLFHPGSHVGQGIEQGIEFIVDAMNAIIVDDEGPWVLLEGMSGKGSEVGGKAEELAQIIQGVKHNKKVGVCIDTCHMHAAGYDIVNDLEGVLKEMDKAFGLEKIKGVHINGNMNELNSHKDRHAVLGTGSIGVDALVKVILHEKLAGLPFVLETPNELDGYAAEIKMLRAEIKMIRNETK